MVIERKNGEVIIRISSSVLTADLEQLVNYLRYTEIAQKSKAKKSDLDDLIKAVKRKRKVSKAA